MNGDATGWSRGESAVQSAFSLLKAGRRRAVLTGGPGASAPHPPHATSPTSSDDEKPFDRIGFSDRRQVNGAPASTGPGGGSALHLSDLAVQVG